MWGLGNGLCCVLAALSLCLAGCEGRVFDVKAESAFTFVGRFAFGDGDSTHTGPPQVQWYITDSTVTPNEVSGYNLVMYNDKGYSWNVARDIIEDGDLWKKDTAGACQSIDGSACADCESCVMRICTKPNPIDVISTNTGPHQALVTIGQKATPHTAQITESGFWYVGITNCFINATVTRSPRKVRVTMLNKGGFFRKQFGVDEQGILEFSFILVPIFGIMTGTYICTTFLELKNQGTGAQVHAVVKWFIAVILLQLVYYVDKMYAYWVIGEYGSGGQTFTPFRYIASVMYIMLIVNFATGFSALGVEFFSPLKDPSHRKFIVRMGVGLMVLKLFSFFYEYATYDNMSTDYDHYQTWPAFIIASLRIPIGYYFVTQLRVQIKDMPECRKYYLRWGIPFFLYIISLPFLMILAFVVPPVDKFRCVDIIYDIITVISMSGMCVLLWPGPGLTVTLSNTYTMAAGGVQHMPMADEPADGGGVLNRSVASLRAGGPGTAPPAAGGAVVRSEQVEMEPRVSTPLEGTLTALEVPLGADGDDDEMMLMSS